MVGKIYNAGNILPYIIYMLTRQSLLQTRYITEASEVKDVIYHINQSVSDNLLIEVQVFRNGIEHAQKNLHRSSVNYLQNFSYHCSPFLFS